jgi:hypothetical protein
MNSDMSPARSDTNNRTPQVGGGRDHFELYSWRFYNFITYSFLQFQIGATCFWPRTKSGLRWSGCRTGQRTSGEGERSESQRVNPVNAELSVTWPATY